MLTIQPPVDFSAGFSSPIPSINLVVLSLLEKATYRKGDVEIVAGEADVVASLIRLWLRTPDTAVAGRAHDVIVGLLMENQGSNTISDSEIADEGLMWRRIMRDRDVYGSIFSICSLSTTAQDGTPSRREKTIAQARLLDLLLKIDSNSVRTSQIPEVEQRFGVENGGLLHFAAIHMVDYLNDLLMHMTLLDFYANYLGTGKTFALQFLKTNGLHARSMTYYLEPEKQDSLDRMHLYGSSAKYIGTYCSKYPEDLISSPTAGHILKRVTQALHNTSPSQWAQRLVPIHDLVLLTCLPRIMLIPSIQATSPLFLLPVKPASQEALTVLGHLFGTRQDSTLEEKAAARALYYLKMEDVSDFWRSITAAAETVALKENALAALAVIDSVIMADWAPLPDTESSGQNPYKLPTESGLASKCHVESLPLSGIKAIMTEPSLSIVMTYLMRPAKSFGNLVSGGRGDVESAVYKVATAKHDVLKHLHQKLKEWLGTCDIVSAVERRVARGPMGGTSEVGGQVGTIEL